ncbi:MAG: divalent-cation tolerance protein CutA [Deltaproteobacteria bacterium]|nr:divalent-cation tolerance protein CutA [Deltaproteobacteria bacterium]MBW2446482.1 divalent-cation tolerance protein CutA [Deltaproteobacteria bacterium]
MAVASDPEIRVVLVTAVQAEAESLGRTLVGERLAACVNVVPGVRSIYRWEGEVQADEEALLVIKTTEAGLPALTERVRALHSYDLPEVLALPAVGGSAAYLSWVAGEVQS